MSKIKKPGSVENHRVISPVFKKSSAGISFSFESLDITEYFNLDGTCVSWASDLFEMMKNVSSIPKNDLIQKKYRTYRVHPHSNANPPSQLPEGIALNDLYQIRISKSKGGIHGVFFEDVFYVVWIDPHHNLYPSEIHGGRKKITPPNTCCKDRDIQLEELIIENECLKKENSEWKELVESA